MDIFVIDWVPTDSANVEALRHRGHRSCQMDVPFQLKMILASINMQKTSRQGVRTHLPMVLLASSLILNLSFLLSKKAYLLSLYEGPLYSVRSSVLFNGGKTFWLVMMALSWWHSHHCPVGSCQKSWDDLPSFLSFLFAGGEV